MPFIGAIRNSLSTREWAVFIAAIFIFIASLVARAAIIVNENSVYIPVRGGSYIEGVLGQPITINPAVSKNLADLDISSLVYSPISDLILTTEVSPDGKTYSIKLKENLKWDDGVPLTSDDIIFTIQTIQSSESRSPSAKNWQGVSMERVSELHVIFMLPDPFSFFPNVLKRTRVIPKHIFGNIPIENFRLSAYNLEPVSSGPYKVKGFSKRRDGFITEYHLIPNPNYFGEAPRIENFYFKFYQTSDELAEAFRLREVNGFGSLSPIDSMIQGTSRIKVETIPMPRYYAIFINQANNTTLKNSSIREALDISIDKAKLAELLGKGSVSPIFGPLTLPENASEPNEMYNPDVAREILEKAKAQEMKLNLVVPNEQIFMDAADFVKRSWVGVGIGEVNIFPIDTETVLESTVKTRDYEMLLFGNILENPLDLFPFWYSSQRLSPKLNLSAYQNSEVDIFIENVRKSNNEKERSVNATRAASIIQNDVPAIFLFTIPYFYAHTEKLAGVDANYVVTPSDRFENITRWSVVRARVLR